MIKKIVVLGLATLVLGGCTLQDVKNSFMGGNKAAVDTQTGETTTTTPTSTATTSPDAALLQANPSTSPQNDDKSLETDINNTNVVNEDFSDLGQ